MRDHQPRGGTDLEHALGQRVGLFTAVQGVLRQFQARQIGGQGQPGIADIGHQADLHIALVLLRLQERLQARLAEVAHPAPEVDLIAGKAQLRSVLLSDRGLAGIAQLRTAAAARALALRGDARQQIGARDAVLGPRFFDVVHGHAQVAVVAQGQCHHFAQLRALDPGLRLRELQRARAGLHGRARLPAQGIRHAGHRRNVMGCQVAG